MPKTMQQETIDGVVYQVTPLGGNESFEAVARVGFGAGLQRISPENFLWLRERLAAGTKVGIIDKQGDGRTNFVPLDTVFNEHFRGNSPAMLQWFKFAFEVSFGPFGDVVRALTRGVMELLRSGFRQNATGPSGDSSSASG
jgi:hypothetical protein